MSKDLFMLMREQEIVTNNFLPSKKEIITSGEDFVKKIVDSGEYNLEEVFAQSVRMEAAITTITKELKKALPDESFESFGIKATYRSGGDSINYEDDPVYSDLKQKIKDRELLLKTALKSKETIYDSEGVEVPKVSTTPRKSSISVKF